ncbi:PAAR domain-containing protein [Phreatobacter stygius]|uniref:Type VI secretion protein n=1 Tax=Phreatobacter stygius TaxID=1940610 RepID=A0A4D7B7E5_9HYPH|nr:PAAR domain-containing protein [Phreatobacter stygius]QCI64062.1 type VI secretion protein [Phreatobacter stygius]
MGRPAARLTDMHMCPMVAPAMTPIVAVGMPNVLIGALPAARITDVCVCVPVPDPIITGSTSVLIGGLPAARIADLTLAGGAILTGCFTVLIGG